MAEIADLKVHLLEAPLDDPIGMSFGSLTARRSALVEIIDTDGEVGWGEGWANYPAWAGHERVQSIVTGLRPMLLGRSAGHIVQIYQQLVRQLVPLGRQWGAVGPMMQAISAVEMALWDLTGKVTGKSVGMLLGGQSRAKVPVYASGLGPTGVKEAVRECLALGFRTLKLRVGFGKDVDGANLETAWSLTEGTGVTLVVDANRAWSLREALDIAPLLQRFDVSWVEEPLESNSMVELEEFSRRSGVRVAIGENLYGFDGFAPIFNSTEIDLIQPDVSKVGGIATLNVLIHAAWSTRIAILPHLYGGPVALAATLQCASISEAVEAVEYDIKPNVFHDELLTRPLVVETTGDILVPEGPGLGIEVDQAVLERYRIKQG